MRWQRPKTIFLQLKIFPMIGCFLTPAITAKVLSPENTSWAQRLLGRYGDKAIDLVNESSPDERHSLDETEFSSS